MLTILKNRLDKKEDITDLVNEVVDNLESQKIWNVEYLYRLIKWSLDNPQQVKDATVDSLIKRYEYIANPYDWKFSDIQTRVFTNRLKNKEKFNERMLLEYGGGGKLNSGNYSYDNFFFAGYCLYRVHNKNWRNVMSIGGKLFRPLARNKMYSNHIMRGLQYILSDIDIETARKEKADDLNEINFCIPEFCFGRQNNQLVHIIAIDEKYFDRFKDCIIYRNRMNEGVLHLHLMNPRQDQIAEIKILQQRGEHIGLSFENISCNDLKAYYIARRFLLAKELLRAYPSAEIFLVTDADIVLQKNKLKNLIYDFKSADANLACKFHNANIPWTSVGAGMIVLKTDSESNRKKTFEFLDLFSKLYISLFEPDRSPYMNTQWYIDQGILISLVDYLEMRPFILNEYEGKAFAFPRGIVGKSKEDELESIALKLSQD